MKKSALKNQQGFTLIEMIVVMVLVAALAAIAIPRYQNYKSRARAAEAANIIGALISEAETYREINGNYTNFGTSAAFTSTVTARGQYFTYSTNTGDASGISITATGNGTLAGSTLTATLDLNNATQFVTWAATGLCISPTT